jgi:hypothetical protein
MAVINAILAALPVIGKILVLFIKSPEEKLSDLSKALLSKTEELHAAVKKAKETKGDTGAIEDVLNRRK